MTKIQVDQYFILILRGGSHIQLPPPFIMLCIKYLYLFYFDTNNRISITKSFCGTIFYISDYFKVIGIIK